MNEKLSTFGGGGEIFSAWSAETPKLGPVRSVLDIQYLLSSYLSIQQEKIFCIWFCSARLSKKGRVMGERSLSPNPMLPSVLWSAKMKGIFVSSAKPWWVAL